MLHGVALPSPRSTLSHSQLSSRGLSCLECSQLDLRMGCHPCWSDPAKGSAQHLRLPCHSDCPVRLLLHPCRLPTLFFHFLISSGLVMFTSDASSSATPSDLSSSSDCSDVLPPLPLLPPLREGVTAFESSAQGFDKTAHKPKEGLPF